MTDEFKEVKEIQKSPEAQRLFGDVGKGSMSGQYPPSDKATISTGETADDLADVGVKIQEIPGIQQDDWNQIKDLQKRLQVLQDVEDTLATEQGRPSIPISTYEGPSYSFGGYNPETNIIRVNMLHVRGHDVQENVATIAHEGRHAYQQYAVDNPGFHPNPQEVAAWKENTQPGNYIQPKEDFEAYVTQPIEADAFAYEQQIKDAVYGEE